MLPIIVSHKSVINPQNTQHRAHLRSHLRQKRRLLSNSEQTRAALSVRTLFCTHPWFKRAKHIAFYWPSDGELNPLPLLKLANKLGKKCYLPVIYSDIILFRQYKSGDRLKKNFYQIPEPLPKQRKRTAHTMDLILLPLVGFDSKGNRLGMGGGYYDKTLADSRHNGPKRIGLAHQCQRIEFIPTEKWDIPLHLIVTSKALYTIKWR